MTGPAAESAGYEADPAEAAALAGVEAILEGWPGDPGAQAAALSSRLATLLLATDLTATARARAVAGMHAGGKGTSYAQIAAALGVSRARAQQLAEAGRAAGPSPWRP